jgi:hypothetical protein
MERVRYPHKTRGCDRITCISNGGTNGWSKALTRCRSLKMTSTGVRSPRGSWARPARSTEILLERMILFGEEALRTTVREFVALYHCERNRQGIDNLLIFPDRSVPDRIRDADAARVLRYPARTRETR